jgi:D-sedoheptulose 7-phosphate isomerase
LTGRRAIVDAVFAEAAAHLERLRRDEPMLQAIERCGHMLAERLAAGRLVLSCGNGGSMCDAMHFAEELSGRFRQDRPPLRALAISDPSYLTCAGNDYGFEQVFARFVSAHAGTGDVLLAISTSGKSPNVLRAAEVAREIGVEVVALTGRQHTPLARLAHLEICTPAGAFADRVQELHIKVLHALIELIEHDLFSGGHLPS